jgi:hypothetical protein
MLMGIDVAARRAWADNPNISRFGHFSVDLTTAIAKS